MSDHPSLQLQEENDQTTTASISNSGSSISGVVVLPASQDVMSSFVSSSDSLCDETGTNGSTSSTNLFYYGSENFYHGRTQAKALEKMDQIGPDEEQMVGNVHARDFPSRKGTSSGGRPQRRMSARSENQYPVHGNSFDASATQVKGVVTKSSKSMWNFFAPRQLGSSYSLWNFIRPYLLFLEMTQVFYYALSLPLRFGLYYDPFWTDPLKWTPALTFFTIVDIFMDLFGVLLLIERTLRHRGASAKTHISHELAVHSSRTASRLRSRRSFPYLYMNSLSSHTGFLQETRVSIADLIAIIPLELIVFSFSYEYLHLVRLTKTLRIFSMPRLLRSVNRHMAHLSWMRPFQSALNYFLTRMVLGGILWVHWTAMIYTLIAHCECGIQQERCSQPGDSWAMHDELQYATNSRKYARAMYWASRTIITLGFSDVTATTDWESFYTILMEFAGAFWCATVISSWGYLFATMNTNIQEHEIFMYNVSKYFKNTQRHIPQEVQDKMITYLEYKWRQTNGHQEDRLLGILPEHFQNRFGSEVKTSHLLKLNVFAGESVGFLNHLSRELNHASFSPLDWIIQTSEPKMYVVLEGKIAIQHATSGLKLKTCYRGDSIAEIALFMDDGFQEKAFAETFSEVLVLTKESLHKTLREYYPSKTVIERFKDMQTAAIQDDEESRNRLIPGTKTLAPALTGIAGSIGTTADPVYVGISTAWDEHKQLLESKNWRHLSSFFRRRWEITRCWALIYLALEVPYIVVFYYGQNGNFGEWGFNITFLLSLMIEMFFYADFYLRSYHFMIPEQRGIDFQSSKNPQVILAEYKKNGGYYLDLLANLPLALVFDISDGLTNYDKSYSALTLLRLLRVIRVRQLNTLVKTTLSKLAGATQFIVYCILSICVYCHFVGCIWYITGRESLRSGAPFTPIAYGDMTRNECWRQAQKFGNCSWTLMDGIEMEGVDPKTSYLRSLYFSISTFTTVAYGDILPHSVAETWIAGIATFIGGILCYGVVGSMGSAITRLVGEKRNFLYHEHLVNRFLAKNHISTALQHQIRRFYLFAFQAKDFTIEQQLLTQLSPGLKSLLRQWIHQENVNKLEFLTLSDGEGGHNHIQLVTTIASCMSREVYYAKDLILRAGEPMDKLFIVRTGTIQVMHPETNSAWFHLTDGDTYGERYLFGSLKHHPFRLKALFITDVSVITKDDLVLTLQAHFPDVLQQIESTCLTMHEKVLKENQHVAQNLQRSKVQDVFGLDVDSLSGSKDSVVRGASRRPTHSAFLTFNNPTSPTGATTLPIALRLNTIGSKRTWMYHLQDKMLAFSRESSGSWATFRLLWELMNAFIVLYNTFSVIARVVFVPEPSTGSMVALTIVDYCFDFLLLVDIFFKWNYFTPKEDVTGKMTRKEIASHYRQKGWFFYDIVSLLPLYYIGDNFKLMTWCRLPRMVRAFQLLESSEIIQSFFAQKFPSPRSHSLFGLMKVVFLFILCCHLGGSVYFWIGLYEQNTKYGWIFTDVVTSINLDNMSACYVRAFYWAMSTFTVVNYGDIFATTLMETCWACLICLTGTFFMSNVGGEMVELIHSIDRTATEQNQKLEAFHHFAHVKSLPLGLREKAYQFMSFQYELTQGLNAKEIFQTLAPSLRQRLFGELHQELLNKIPLFSDLDRIQKEEIANLLYSQIYMPKDIIVFQRSAGMTLFMMKHGRAEVVKEETGLVLAQIEEGSLFGEISFFHPEITRLASIRAVTYCEILQLDRDAWEQFCVRARNALVHNLLVQKTSQSKVVQSTTRKDSFGKFTRDNNTESTTTSSEPIGGSNGHPAQLTANLSSIQEKVATRRRRNSSVGHGEDSSHSSFEVSSSAHDRYSSASGLTFGLNASATGDRLHSDNTILKSLSGPSVFIQPELPSLIPHDTTTGTLPHTGRYDSKFTSKMLIDVKRMATSTPKPMKNSLLVETSWFRYLWDGCKLLAIVYYVVAIPLRVAFYEDLTHYSIDFVKKWMEWEYIFDVFFLIDIYMRLYHFIPVVFGEVVKDRKSLRGIYMKSSGFWIDVIASIPLELLTLLPISYFKENPVFIVSIFRLEILVRCIQMGSLWARLERYFFYESEAVLSGNVVTAIKIIVVSIASCHWIGCLWYYVARSTLGQYPMSWLTTPFMLIPDPTTVKIEDITLLTKYLRTYHYAIGSMSTVTYGDICSRNTAETIVQVGIIFLCIAFYGYITGGTRRLLENYYAKRIEFETTLEQMNRFGNYRGVSKGLALCLCKHLNQVWKYQGDVDEEKALSNLSTNLYRDIRVYMRQALLQNANVIFKDVNSALIHAVLAALKEEIYMTQDIIYEENEFGSHLYFVEKGMILMTNYRKTMEVVKKNGDFFGEKSLLYKTPRKETCVALAKSHLAILTRENYERIISFFPEHKTILEKVWTTQPPAPSTMKTIQTSLSSDSKPLVVDDLT